MNTRIAFCTTCKGRTQHLRETLPKNLADNADYDDAVFIVLDYSSQDDLTEYMRANHAADIESGRIAFYHHYGQPKFQMAHAKNMAHRLGILHGADILVNLDADGFTGPGFARYVADKMRPQCFMQALWNRWVDASETDKGHEVDGSRWVAQDPEGNYCEPVPKGCNGRMVVTADQFVLAGGYDEKHNTWGPDDKDFQIRLRRLGFQIELLPREFLATILHNDKMRFRDYPAAIVKKNGYCFQISIHDSDAAIANSGSIGCGTVVVDSLGRGHAWEHRRELAPLPTRIFGIGWHKTATTSLHMALSRLGFNSAHWTDAHWAKAIFREMRSKGHSSTLERHYAVCDLPIPLFFRELDRAYPGSKFIHTFTEPDVWAEAARLHWDTNSNPQRQYWDQDPFTNQLHNACYGRKKFDRAVFLERYNRHNREVREYFRDRESDIVYMPMSHGAGWRQLCEAFGKDVPAEEYPHGNKPDTWRHWIHAGEIA